MSGQLNVKSDEALIRAKRLAKRHGLTVTDVVVRALRKMEGEEAPSLGPFERLPPKLKRDHEHFKRLARKAREEAGALATSDHNDLYDESGLPK